LVSRKLIDSKQGISYTIDRVIGKCIIEPLGSNFDSISLTANGQVPVKMRNPLEFLKLDDETYFYAGQVKSLLNLNLKK
jgi:hypothetical protein